jgi:hypothetical protein
MSAAYKAVITQKELERIHSAGDVPDYIAKEEKAHLNFLAAVKEGKGDAPAKRSRRTASRAPAGEDNDISQMLEFLTSSRQRVTLLLDGASLGFDACVSWSEDRSFCTLLMYGSNSTSFHPGDPGRVWRMSVGTEPKVYRLLYMGCHAKLGLQASLVGFMIQDDDEDRNS